MVSDIIFRAMNIISGEANAIELKEGFINFYKIKSLFRDK